MNVTPINYQPGNLKNNNVNFKANPVATTKTTIDSFTKTNGNEKSLKTLLKRLGTMFAGLFGIKKAVDFQAVQTKTVEEVESKTFENRNSSLEKTTEIEEEIHNEEIEPKQDLKESIERTRENIFRSYEKLFFMVPRTDLSDLNDIVSRLSDENIAKFVKKHKDLAIFIVKPEVLYKTDSGRIFLQQNNPRAFYAIEKLNEILPPSDTIELIESHKDPFTCIGTKTFKYNGQTYITPYDEEGSFRNEIDELRIKLRNELLLNSGKKNETEGDLLSYFSNNFKTLHVYKLEDGSAFLSRVWPNQCGYFSFEEVEKKDCPFYFEEEHINDRPWKDFSEEEKLELVEKMIENGDLYVVYRGGKSYTSTSEYDAGPGTRSNGPMETCTIEYNEKVEVLNNSGYIIIEGSKIFPTKKYVGKDPRLPLEADNDRWLRGRLEEFKKQYDN